MESSSPLGNGLSHLFSKSSGHRSKNSSNVTSSAASEIMSTDGTFDSHDTATTRERRGLRAHFERGLEKLKELKGPASDGDSGSLITSGASSAFGGYDGHGGYGGGDEGSYGHPSHHGTGVGKLMPKRIKSKRRKRREAEAEGVERGRSVAERGTLENVGVGEEYRPYSRQSCERSRTGSSLLTVESDVDAVPTPPPLSRSHPSHAGYLTTSSPLVRTFNEPVAQLDGPITKALTFPLESNEVASTETSQVSGAHELQAPAEGNRKRTPSPVGRLAAVLKPRSSSSPNSSPEGSKSGGRSGSFGKDKDPAGGSSRRGSVASKIGNIFPDRSSSNSGTSSPERLQPGKALLTAPQTPPNADNQAPLIVNTPPTPTDHSAPQFPSSQQKESPKIFPIITNSNIITSPSGNMISHRRLRSGSGTLGPSKLSNITSAPLTPTPENGSPQTGFFSQMYSAVQSATNTLTNSIGNTNSINGATRSRSGTHDSKVDGDDVEVELLSEKVATSGDATEEKELAVKTMGEGDLSLSHLGITETNPAPTPTNSKFPDSEGSRGRSGTAESLPARVGASNVMEEPLKNGSSAQVDEYHQSTPPREASTFPVAGSQTPPNGSIFEGKDAVHRSGSVRSALGAARRKRGSSAATGHTSLGTIGAAIVAANHSLANPIAQNGSTPKLTGFAVASKKRNKDFHQLFRSVPDDDYLIEDYSCALQKEILAHGRLYVSEGHLCFSSNIMGWINTLVMSFEEIVSVEKRSTAYVFKNGLMISTLHARHIFASFVSRDLTYDLIVGIWKLGHPSLTSSLNGVRIDETGGDKTEKDDGIMSQEVSNSESESEDGDDVYDEDDDGMSFTQAGEGSVVGSEAGEKVLSRKASATVVSGEKDGSSSSESKDFPGPVTHAPTDCTDQDQHYDRMLLDEVIAAPLGKIYGLMFGPNSSAWMSRWLSVDQKCLELVMEDKKGLSDENRSRNYSYIKPLNGAIGPKQTKCVTTETLDFMDLERSVSVTMSTATPDVPSGNAFLTKTRYCLSWAEGGATRIQINCTIEWSSKSWLKGPIEKGANDGQIAYSRDLIVGLKAALSAKPKPSGSNGVVIKGGKKKGRRGHKSAENTPGLNNTVGAETSPKATKSPDWGYLQGVYEVMKQLGDIAGPLLSGNLVYGLFAILFLAYWLGYISLGSGGATGGRRNSGGGNGGGMGFLASPDRIAAYEEIWRREESELWEWLEERVGMERVMTQTQRGGGGSKVESNVFGAKLAEQVAGGKVGEKEIEDAIRVTEDKLRALKGVVERRKVGELGGAGGGGGGGEIDL